MFDKCQSYDRFGYLTSINISLIRSLLSFDGERCVLFVSNIFRRSFYVTVEGVCDERDL